MGQRWDPRSGWAATPTRAGGGLRGGGKGRVVPAFRVRPEGELRELTLREGRLGASQDWSSSSSSPASRGEATPSSPAASTSLTALPGAPLGGWAQAIRGSSGSRSSSSSSSRLPPPSADASRPGSEDSAMASLRAFCVETGSERRAARLWPRHRGGPQWLGPVEDLLTGVPPAPRQPGGCPRAAASRAPPRANPAPARKGGGGGGRGRHLQLLEREDARWGGCGRGAPRWALIYLLQPKSASLPLQNSFIECTIIHTYIFISVTNIFYPHYKHVRVVTLSFVQTFWTLVVCILSLLFPH